MNYNKCIYLVHKAEEDLWVDTFNHARLHESQPFCKWVSTFHSDQLTCKLDGGFLHGSYNVCQKVIFDDGTIWLVRFPRVGSICDYYADEKVAMEVEVMSLLQEKTTIPVPKIHAWGVAANNPLKLGPFIIMDFIPGESLNRFLVDPDGQPDTRLMREDISDSDIEFIYRQMANFLLQIFKLDFDRIGSLPTPKTGFSVPIRPLTWKVHDILQDGGVNTFGNRSRGFSSTTEYFQYVVGQDWEQLNHQKNSITGPLNAQARYKSFKILASLIPDYINKEYEHGPFKLICDDLGLANMIVKSKEDLTIIGVVDLEWSYIAPAQLFGSAPWWLLQDRPTNCDWDYEGDTPPKIAPRYSKYLRIFQHVLEEEEERLPGNEDKQLSKLVKWSEDSGAMWLHMLLSSGFNDHYSFPFMRLREHIGFEKWARYWNQVDNTEEIKTFVAKKTSELAQYDRELAKIEALMESGGMITL